MPRYQEQLAGAVRHFWKTRSDQAKRQGGRSGIKDYGNGRRILYRATMTA